jgi:ABC-2 type transport system ATP-binding protein
MKHIPAVSVSGVSKRYGRTQALEAIDLELPPGSALALIGRNGAGKSTLLRILMGFFPPSRGEAKIFGIRIGALTESDRAAIGYVADNQELPDGMTHSVESCSICLICLWIGRSAICLAASG